MVACMENIQIIFKDDDADRLLSLAEIAKRLGTNKTFASALVQSGALPCVKFGRTRRVSRITFQKFIQEHQGHDLYEVVKECKKEKG